MRRFWGKRKEKYEREEYAKDEDEFSCFSLSVFLSVLLKALRMFVCVFMNCVTLLRVRFYRQFGGRGQLL